MIPKELDDLIKEYLTDGIISEAERRVLLRKAEKLGLDLDEIDLYITAQEQKVDNKVAADKKEAFGKRCPNCGRQVESLTITCECGYEFKNDKAVSSVQILSEKILAIQNNKKLYDDDKEEQILAAIDMFAVPNTKEDIMEFLALSVPNAQSKGGLWTRKGAQKALLYATIAVAVLCLVLGIGASHGSIIRGIGVGCLFAGFPILIIQFFGQGYISTNKQIKHNDRYNIKADAWRRKYEQVMMKGRSLRADAEFTRMLDYYEQKMDKSE